MLQSSLSIRLQAPDCGEFIALRAKVGWGDLDTVTASQSLKNSLFHVCVYDSSILAGMGRVVGDGYMYFYVQDVVVSPEYQGQGIGLMLVDKIEGYLTSAASKGATIGLLSAKGKEGFYRQYGYIDRPSESLGMGMCKFI